MTFDLPALDLAGRFAGQLAQPRGIAGGLLGRVMDLANRKPMARALDLLAPLAGEDILDAGCGTGLAMQAMLRRASCSVAGVDRSVRMVNAARRRLASERAANRADVFLAELAQAPFAPGRFDAVLALNVLYFDDADHSLLRAARAMLREGGRLVGYVTARETMQRWSFARQGLHRLYDAAQLEEACVRAGFAQVAVEVHEVPITRSVQGLLVRAWR